VEQQIKITEDSIKVTPLDMDKLNKDMTAKIGNGFGWHVGFKWGIISEPRPCLVETECVTSPSQMARKVSPSVCSPSIP